jgi:hypothetical protein
VIRRSAVTLGRDVRWLSQVRNRRLISVRVQRVASGAVHSTTSSTSGAGARARASAREGRVEACLSVRGVVAAVVVSWMTSQRRGIVGHHAHPATSSPPHLISPHTTPLHGAFSQRGPRVIICRDTDHQLTSPHSTPPHSTVPRLSRNEQHVIVVLQSITWRS